MYIYLQIILAIEESLKRDHVVAILGPLQCGKSTLVKHVIADRKDTIYLDLESPSDSVAANNSKFWNRRNPGQ